MTTKKDLRPTLPEIASVPGMSPAEHFQNRVLRPVLKMQHELLMAMVRQALDNRKIVLSTMKKEQQVNTLKNLLRKLPTFKEELRGVVLGQMELEEYQEYLTVRTEANKRITTMLAQRIMDSLDELV